MSRYKQIAKATEQSAYIAHCTKTVKDGSTLLYAEFFGHKSDCEMISKSFKSKNIHSKGLTYDGSCITTSELMSVTKMPISKNRVAYLATSKEAFGRTPSVFIGRDSKECYRSFMTWLSYSQPLPYPRGYKEELGMEAEEYIFHEMITKGLLRTLDTTGKIIAYSLASKYSEKSEIMMGIIISCVKKAGLLEVDRFKKILRDNAPDIGEAVSDNAHVHVTIENTASNVIYHVIEYDRNTEDAFCLINNKGTIEWEQINFTTLFDDEDNKVNKSEEYQNIKISDSGLITKVA